MFFRPKRGRRGPHILLIRESEEPIRLDESWLAAWALSIGQRREAELPFRPHRGELPDVDLSRTVPAPRKAGLVSRLLGWLAGGRAGSPDAREAAGETAVDAVALGESRRTPYVWTVDVESGPSGADDVEPDAAAVEYNGSRAA